MTYEERVANGIALLDEHYPGWDVHINTLTLSIDDPCLCVCGQLETAGVLAEGWGPFGAPDVGRNAGVLSMTSDGSEYEGLTDTWKDAIRERRRRTVKEQKQTAVLVEA